MKYNFHKFAWLFSLFVVVSSLLFPRASLAYSGRERKIIVFQKETPVFAQRRLLSERKIGLIKQLRFLNAHVAYLNLEEIAALKLDARVLRIDSDVEVWATGISTQASICEKYPWLPRCSKPTSTPTPIPTPTPGPEQNLPWGVVKIKAPESWSLSKGAGVKVAILDTGIDTDHPDLAGNLVGCVNFINPSRNCEDDNGHGTHVAGIIGALDNGIGVVGVAPEARLYALKILDRQGRGYLSDIIEGLDWAINNGIQVINLSLGTTSDIVSFREEIQKTLQAGISVVAAAGNSGPAANSVNYPARYEGVVAVAATDSVDQIPSWSSRGPEVDVAAPGKDVYSTYLKGNYQKLSGTSMAAPHVTGAVALKLFLGPKSPGEIELLLETSADTLPFDPALVGAGLVNTVRFINN